MENQIVRQPEAFRNKISSLCDAYDGVAALYGISEAPFDKHENASRNYLRMPTAVGAKYETAIRHAILSSCATLAEFNARVERDLKGGFTEERIKESLRDAYESRRRLPYSVQSAYFQSPFNSSETHFTMVRRYNDHSRGNQDADPSRKTMVVAETMPHTLNLCISNLQGEGFKRRIADVAQDFCKWAEKNRPDILRHSMKLYMHTPVECSSSGKDEFHLVEFNTRKRSNETPRFIPQAGLPRSIERAFYHHGPDLIRDFQCHGAHNDFRGFALRAM